MAALTVGLLCMLGTLDAVAGVPIRTFDQRQQGELNIHAQLDNIVIVLVPTSNLNLLELTGKIKHAGDRPDKGGFLQIFQKPYKTDVDRYEIIKDEPQLNHAPSTDSKNDIKTEVVVPVISSQQVALKNEEKQEEKGPDKEEEVIATVEEMGPENTVKATDLTKSEAIADIPLKEHHTVSETTQESILKVLKHDEEVSKDACKECVPVESLQDQTPEKASESNPSEKHDKELPKNEELPNKEHSSITNQAPTNKEKQAPDASLESYEPSIQDLIKPVVVSKEENTQTSVIPKRTSSAVKEPSIVSTKSTYVSDEVLPTVEMFGAKKTPNLEEEAVKKTLINTGSSQSGSKKGEPARLVEGARKEKVIKYMPDTKWAPELVDLLGPPKMQEKQRFAGLCSPGAWDTELKTCIMPGETRSRNELARFLEAMRFGIAVPAR